MNYLKPSLIISGAIIIAVIVAGFFYLGKGATTNTLSVTGSARLEVVADQVTWRSSLSRSMPSADLKNGYTQLALDIKAVELFMQQQSIPKENITISPVSVTEEWNQDANAPKRFTLRQYIEVRSADVQGITKTAKSVEQLVAQGLFFQTDSLEYYYSGLADARVTLLTDAITDAKNRAAAMARASNQKVGALQSASSGVVQVLSRGAIDNGEYGQYDTSKIEKDITITVRGTFELK